MISPLKKLVSTGIPGVSVVGNGTKSISRAFVFLLCFIGFIYQVAVFMSTYREYETVFDMKVSNPTEVELPSITLCNFNGFQNSKVCADPQNEQFCDSLENNKDWKWCDCLPRYCEDGVLKENMKAPRWREIEKIGEQPVEEYQKYLLKFEEFVPYCVYTLAHNNTIREECDASNYKSIRCPSEFVNIVNVCYTLNSLLDQPEGVQPKISTNAFLTIILRAKAEEYTTKIKAVSGQVSFHSPRTVVSPYTHGFTLYPSYKYKFRIKKIVKELLPYPYDTNCVDYLTMWKVRGGKGPTNQRECMDECQKNASLKLNGCIESAYLVPGNERRCNILFENAKTVKLSQACAEKNCGPACYEEYYEVVEDVVDKDYYPSCGKDKSQVKDEMTIELSFIGMEMLTYTARPKYQKGEAFGTLVGYILIWLGIAMLTMFDFFDSAIILLQMPYKRYVDVKGPKMNGVETPVNS